MIPPRGSDLPPVPDLSSSFPCVLPVRYLCVPYTFGTSRSSSAFTASAHSVKAVSLRRRASVPLASEIQRPGRADQAEYPAGASADEDDHARRASAGKRTQLGGVIRWLGCGKPGASTVWEVPSLPGDARRD